MRSCRSTRSPACRPRGDGCPSSRSPQRPTSCVTLRRAAPFCDPAGAARGRASAASGSFYSTA
eukprot:2918782-Pleurochrysis_carterae.AAC.1